MQIVHSHLLLDACCLLNFAASGNLLSILQALPVQLSVTQVVQERELLTLKRVEGEENESITQFEAALAKGLLLVVDFANEIEEELFVNYVAVLSDDGESATCAIAIQRGWAIATDDRRAISFMQQEAPQIQVILTLEIVKYWSEQAGLAQTVLRDVLHRIRVKGRYFPHKNHSLRSWWENAIRDSDEPEYQ